MKKRWKGLTGIVLALLLLFCAQAAAFQAREWADPSGEKTADALILSGTGWFYGILVVTDAANAVTVDIYNNTAASGTKLIPTLVVTTSATDRAQFFAPPFPISCTTGIYVDITCAGAVKYVVYYRAR